MPQTPYNAPVSVGYAHINGAGTTVVKSAPGALFALNINQAASAAAVTIYDNTAASGQVVAQIVFGAAATAPSSLQFGTMDGGITLGTGLTIVTTGTIDLTAAYR